MENSGRNKERDLLKSLMKEKYLCDVTLVAGNDAGDNKTKISAHRCVLSASSGYFRSMFTGSFEESGKSEVTLASVKGDALKQIIDFCYTGEIQPNEENVQAIIEASTEYQFPKIISVCSEYMVSLLCPENCIDFMVFAKSYDLKDLIISSTHMFSINFAAITKGDEFKKLSLEELKIILVMDELDVPSEETIIGAIKIWIAYAEERKGYVRELFQLVRLTLLDQKTVDDLIEEFRGTPAEKLLRNIVFWRSKRSKLQMHNQHLVVFGGQTEDKSVVEYYCAESQEWKYWKHIKQFNSNYKAVAFNNEIYYIGPGNETEKTPNPVYRFNIASGVIENVSNSNLCESYLEVFVVSEGCHCGVYICSRQNAFYRFDGARWSTLSFENGEQATKLAINGEHVYHFHQKDNRSRMDKHHITSTKLTWVNRSYSTINRQNPNIVALNDYIYIIGGVVGSSQVSLVERYDTKDDSWTKLSDSPEKYASFHAFNGTIYGHYTSSVYKYNDKDDIWTKLPPWKESRSSPYLISLNLGGLKKSV